MQNPLILLQELGQSPWHDNIHRRLLSSGQLKKMIRDGDITGLTSNPTIFQQAIADSKDYDDALHRLALRGLSPEEIFDRLAIDDIRHAADLFLPIYRKTKGKDGYVSIEVAPKYARDTTATIREAKRLWRQVKRPNLMVKIPATVEGLPAIEQCIADGLNINVTLIFSLSRYEQVMEAYICGLERRKGSRKPLSSVASVASFFVSRVDTLVDSLLDVKLGKSKAEETAALRRLKGRAAIANAQLAYARFQHIFSTERFNRLATSGARPQWPLWASTSTKNPDYPDVYYIEALVGPDTVNTMPPSTLLAYKDHGKPEVRIDKNLDDAQQALRDLERSGIRMARVTSKLEEDGVAAFAKSYDDLIAVVAARTTAMHMNRQQRYTLAAMTKKVDQALAKMDQAQLGRRLWKMDTTLWKPEDPKHQEEIRNRLGWLRAVDLMLAKQATLAAFTSEVQKKGFTHALVCGMGGSSLAPEVLRKTFGVTKGFLDLAILDSTDPAAVLRAAERSDPRNTLYIISSKSGTTTEPMAFFKTLWDRVRAVERQTPGAHFVAITDPGTPLQRLARRNKFRQIFLNPVDIGGRYSALSYFGLVPASLMGVDTIKLLGRAKQMMSACGPTVSAPLNPGLALGAALGVMADAGRDKVTFLISDSISSFGYWIEQLVAESTGKEGKGIVPVEGEPELPVACYGADRFFVHLRLGQKRHPLANRLARAGQPVAEFQLTDRYDLGAEFLRWEIATAAAAWSMRINPFDQPNVQEAKDNTNRLLQELKTEGRLPQDNDCLPVSSPDFAKRLPGFLKGIRKRDYVAIMAYFEGNPARLALLNSVRAAIGRRYCVATTLGFGPRFLHSTGQLHKGGADNGVFIQLLCQDPKDVSIPGQPHTFSALKSAQALGDFQALASRGRRVVRIDLGRDIPRGLKAVAGTLGV